VAREHPVTTGVSLKESRRHRALGCRRGERVALRLTGASALDGRSNPTGSIAISSEPKEKPRRSGGEFYCAASRGLHRETLLQAYPSASVAANASTIIAFFGKCYL
jgi:hypothetical protein